MSDRYGIDPVKDFLPYITGFFAWVGSLNWLLIISILVAVARAYIAWKEYKLKEKIEDRKYAETKANEDGKANTEEAKEG